MNKLESVVIVKGQHGYVAAIRFADGKDDRFISSSSASQKSKETLYTLVEQHVQAVTNGN